MSEGSAATDLNSTIFIALISAIAAATLALLGKFIYDKITRRNQRKWVARAFLTRMSLLDTSVATFESEYFDKIKHLESNWSSYPIEYLIDRIDPQHSFEFETPDTKELSLLSPLSQYFIIALSDEILKRNRLINEANNLLESFKDTNEEHGLNIKIKLRNTLFDLRLCYNGISLLSPIIRDTIINKDLRKFDSYYYYETWDCIAQLYALEEREFIKYDYFKITKPGLWVPYSPLEMRWEFIKRKLKKLYFHLKFWEI